MRFIIIVIFRLLFSSTYGRGTRDKKERTNDGWTR